MADYTEVSIPVVLDVKDEGSLNEYLHRFKQRLQYAQNDFNRQAKALGKVTGAEKLNKDLVQTKEYNERVIASLNDTITKLGDLTKPILEAKREYNELLTTVQKGARDLYAGAMRTGHSVRGGTTEEAQAANIQRMNEAQEKYNSLVAESRKLIEEMNLQLHEGTEEVEAEGRKYSLTVDTLKSTGEAGVQAQKALQQETSEVIALQEELKQKISEVKQKYAEMFSSNKIHLGSEEGQALKAQMKEEIATLQQEYEEKIRILKVDQGDAEAIHEQADIEKEKAKEIRSQIAEHEREKAQVKATTSQYYYRLRAVKMLGFTLTSMNKKMDAFGKTALSVSSRLVKDYMKLAFGFTSFGNVLSKASTNMRNLGTSARSAASSTQSIKSAQDGANLSIIDGIKFMLKYALGIRSVFVLFNRLRSAMSSGMENLATQWNQVNVQMSSVITSMFQMKNAIAAAVQPILYALAPALEHVASIVSDIAYKIASFIAALTGSTQYVYKAKRAQQQYVDTSKDLKDTTEDTVDTTDQQTSATQNTVDAMEDEEDEIENLKKELSGLDKLNVLTSEDEDKKNKNKDKYKEPKIKIPKAKDLKDDIDDLGEAVQDMFDKVPIDPGASKLADFLKDLFSKLFEPIKNAWDKEGQFVMDAWKYALDEIWKLIKDIGRDFMRVWGEAKTQEIFEDLFHILGDIGLIVGHLARNFREAWNYCESGYVILASIRDIIYEIVHGIREAADYTVDWADKLTFVPLLGTIASVLHRQVVPAVQQIVDLAVWLYEYVFLEMLKQTIEVYIPKLVIAFGNIAEATGAIAHNILDALKEGDRGKKIVAAIDRIITYILDGIIKCSEYTREWAKQLDFKPLFDAILNALEKSKPAIFKIIEALKAFYKNVILPLMKEFIEKALPKLVEWAGDILVIVGNIADNIKKAFEENNRGKRLIEAIKPIISKISDTIDDCVEKTKEWSENLDLGPLVESTIKFLEEAKDPLSFICDTFAKFYNDVLLPFREYIIEEGLPKLFDKLTAISEAIKWDELKEKVDAFLESFEPFLEKVWDALVKVLGDLGDAIAKFVNSKEFGKIVDKIIEWMDKADPDEMASGLERIVMTFIEIKAFLGFFSTVVVPAFTTFMTIINAFKQFGMIKKTGKLATQISSLSTELSTLTGSADTAAAATGTGGAAAGGAGGLMGALSSLMPVILIVVVVIGTLFLAYDNLAGIMEKIKETAQDVADYFKQVADNANFSDKLNELKSSFDNLGGAIGTVIDTMKGGEGEINLFKEIWDRLFIAISSFIKLVLGALIPAVSTIISVISGVVNFIGGVILALHATIEAFVGGIVLLISGDDSMLIKSFNDFDAAGRLIWQGFADFFGGIFDGLSQVLTNWTEVLLPGEGEKIWGWTNDVLQYFKDMKYQLIGDPIVYDIRDGVIQGFTDFITQTAQDVSGWVPEIVGFFSNLGTDLGTTVTTAKDAVVDKFGQIKRGLESKGKEAVDAISKKFGDLKKEADNKLKSNALVNNGKQFITGLDSGIKTKFGNVKSTISKGVNDVKKKFRDSLKSNTLTSTGKNLINGLKAGLTSALSSALAAVSALCAKIVAKAKQAFAVRSPSRVFAEIGKNLVLGLDKGIEDNADSVGDAFQEMVPEDDATAKFSNNFLDEMTGLTQDVTKLFDNMFNHIDERLSSLSKLADINALNNKLASINIPQTPDIVKGYQLPSNKEFSQEINVDVDMTRLPQMMREAFIDALKETSNLQTTDGTITINIDGNKVFQAVRNANTVYKKQHGVSAFA